MKQKCKLVDFVLIVRFTVKFRVFRSPDGGLDPISLFTKHKSSVATTREAAQHVLENDICKKHRKKTVRELKTPHRIDSGAIYNASKLSNYLAHYFVTYGEGCRRRSERSD